MGAMRPAKGRGQAERATLIEEEEARQRLEEKLSLRRRLGLQEDCAVRPF